MIKGFYAILNLGCARPYMELLDSAWQGGCRLFQLRAKGHDEKYVLMAAMQIAEYRKTHPFIFIVNDHPDVAIKVGADGVHVGADDPSPESIREKYGKELMIGYSTHSLSEVRGARGGDADYLAFGAVFPSPSKGHDHPVQGLDALHDAVRLAGEKPLVAIGGIDRNNLKGVLQTGVRCVAAIGAWMNAEDVRSEVESWVRATNL